MQPQSPERGATIQIRGRLQAFLESEQEALAKVQALLLCIAQSIETGPQPNGGPYYLGVVELASELVRRRIFNLAELLGRQAARGSDHLLTPAEMGSQASIHESNTPEPEGVPAPGTEETSDAQPHVEQIRAILDAVSVRTREIYFAYRAGFSYPEIAERLNISQRAIKRHIARAVLAIMEHGPL